MQQIQVENAKFNPIKTGFLRALLTNDISDEYILGLNNRAVKQWLNFPKHLKIDWKETTTYVQKNLDDENAILFGFFLEKKLRGTVRIHNASKSNADIGIALFDTQIWGHSWASSILNTIAQIALSECKIKKLTAGIDIKNTASQKAFANAGFSQERPNIYSY